MHIKSVSLISTLLLTACVTINIYFPAAATEKMADEIIQEIQTIEQQSPSPQTRLFPRSQHSQWKVSVYRFIDRAISVVISSAHAEANLLVDNTDIRRIRARMRARFASLNNFYGRGLIGIQADGLLTSRGNISLKERNKVTKMLQAENRDRNQLYHAIANANGHPEWAGKIKTTFATRWVANAQSGWWYQPKNSREWRQK